MQYWNFAGLYWWFYFSILIEWVTNAFPVNLNWLPLSLRTMVQNSTVTVSCVREFFDDLPSKPNFIPDRQTVHQSRIQTLFSTLLHTYYQSTSNWPDLLHRSRLIVSFIASIHFHQPLALDTHLKPRLLITVSQISIQVSPLSLDLSFIGKGKCVRSYYLAQWLTRYLDLCVYYLWCVKERFNQFRLLIFYKSPW